MLKFKAGAVLYDPSTKTLISKGYSHPGAIHSKRFASVHAECAAVDASEYSNLSGHWCIIYTLNGRGGTAWSSRPCLSCAVHLLEQGVERVVYAERTGQTWITRSEHPEELVERAPAPTGRFARQQRIPA